MLAPMVRSGALPTRLFALKHGAKLVWGPEIVDRAILHAERVVDPISGTISYVGKQTRAMFTCHPLEKPYFIYQIGSSSPELAVQAAKVVIQDVSGVELNCGCPTPFSTLGGMGAALLSTPNLLCSILEALRRELPPHISVSAKIRLLPTQEETKRLVERIIDTGVNCVTIHCRTKNMRKNEPARVERLKEIVDFVRELGKDVAIIENGDCVGYEDARKIRARTGADSVMIATAAESNPSIFSPTPLYDLEETLIPSYLRLAKYLDNHWASTKFSVSQFKGSRAKSTKAANKAVREAIIRAKDYADVESLVGEWTGEDELRAIEEAVAQRERSGPPLCMPIPEDTVPTHIVPATEKPATAELTDLRDKSVLDVPYYRVRVDVALGEGGVLLPTVRVS